MSKQLLIVCRSTKGDRADGCSLSVSIGNTEQGDDHSLQLFFRFVTGRILLIMLIIHPLIQLAATLLALYVLLLGVARFRQLHMRQKTLFQWQRHVRLGTIALRVRERQGRFLNIITFLSGRETGK